MGDEVLDLFAGGFPQSLYAAEVGGVGLNQIGIELMLANDLAKTIANLRAAMVSVAIGRLRQLPGLWRRSGLAGGGTNFFDGADADAVRLEY